MEKGQLELQAAVRSFPGFGHVVETHQLVLERAAKQLGVEPSRTRHTGSDGVLLLSSLQPGKASNYFRSYRAPHVPVMTQVRYARVRVWGREDRLEKHQSNHSRRGADPSKQQAPFPRRPSPPLRRAPACAGRTPRPASARRQMR